MAWKHIPGLAGKLYVPDPPPEAAKKHRCIDCFSCQFCSDERCSICMGWKGCRRYQDDEEGTVD